MRLLQAMAGGAHGGAEAFFERLAIAFARTELDQRVLIRSDATRRAKLVEGGVDVVELAFGGRLDFATGRAFAREIETFDPDVVLTWMNRATRFCRHARARRFVHVARLGGYYNLKYYRDCDHLAGNTKDIVRYLVDRGWPESRAHYLPNFVDARPMSPEPRTAHETPGEATLLLALGRLHENKAFDVLLDTLAELPDAWLWIAGEGPSQGELTARAARLGIAERVRFLGWRDDAAALLAAADILVCPSRHEPLGNVVIEGWAHGVPVVAARSAGPAALIRDGETGLLAPIDDAEALARVLARVQGETGLRDALAAAGRSAFEREFTEQAVVAAYRAFFDEVAG